jgi:hypothetical protein
MDDQQQNHTIEETILIEKTQKTQILNEKHIQKAHITHLKKLLKKAELVGL